jgi:cold shock CspA family protein
MAYAGWFASPAVSYEATQGRKGMQAENVSLA